MRRIPELYIQLYAEEQIREGGIDLSGLTPSEVVHLHHFSRSSSDADENSYTLRDELFGGMKPASSTYDDDTAWRGDLFGRMETTLMWLPIIDPDRTRDILLAHLDSANPEVRSYAAHNFTLQRLTKIDPDAGIPIWDRLLRDSDRTPNGVALNAYGILQYCLLDVCDERQLPQEPPHADGFRLLNYVDEAQLEADCGLTRETAYGLLESYAYAENGLYLHDLGREALRKLLATTPLPPGSSSPPPADTAYQ